MKIHTNFAESIEISELTDMVRVLRKAHKNDGHYIADKGELEWLSILFASVMNSIDESLEAQRQG